MKKTKRKPKKTIAELADELGFLQHSPDENDKRKGFFIEHPISGAVINMPKFSYDAAYDILVAMIEDVSAQIEELTEELSELSSTEAKIEKILNAVRPKLKKQRSDISEDCDDE